MRYFFQGDDGKSSTTFTVYIYPEPWCFEETPEEEKEKKSFPLSDEGMDDAIAWLWDRFETEKSKWLDAAKKYHAYCKSCLKAKAATVFPD